MVYVDAAEEKLLRLLGGPLRLDLYPHQFAQQQSLSQ